MRVDGLTSGDRVRHRADEHSNERNQSEKHRELTTVPPCARLRCDCERQRTTRRCAKARVGSTTAGGTRCVRTAQVRTARIGGHGVHVLTINCVRGRQRRQRWRLVLVAMYSLRSFAVRGPHFGRGSREARSRRTRRRGSRFYWRARVAHFPRVRPTRAPRARMRAACSAPRRVGLSMV